MRKFDHLKIIFSNEWDSKNVPHIFVKFSPIGVDSYIPRGPGWCRNVTPYVRYLKKIGSWDSISSWMFAPTHNGCRHLQPWWLSHLTWN